MPVHRKALHRNLSSLSLGFALSLALFSKSVGCIDSLVITQIHTQFVYGVYLYHKLFPILQYRSYFGSELVVPNHTKCLILKKIINFEKNN